MRLTKAAKDARTALDKLVAENERLRRVAHEARAVAYALAYSYENSVLPPEHVSQLALSWREDSRRGPEAAILAETPDPLRRLAG